MSEQTQQAATTNPWLAMPSSDAEWETLEPGSYNGVCIGVIMKEFPNFNDRSKVDQKVQFVFQIVEGGQQYYLKSKPCKVILGDKANLYLLINGWTKATLERMTNGFSCDKMVGYGAQLVTTTRESNGKVYAELANILPLRKGVKVAVTPTEIPAFLAKGAINAVWAPGITVKEETPTAATFPKGLPGGLASAGAGGVPVAGGAGTPVYPPAKSAVPEVPANAQITQNQNAAAFMNPALQVTNPAPQPAPAVPAAEQAPDQDDDMDDLPF